MIKRRRIAGHPANRLSLRRCLTQSMAAGGVRAKCLLRHHRWGPHCRHACAWSLPWPSVPPVVVMAAHHSFFNFSVSPPPLERHPHPRQRQHPLVSDTANGMTDGPRGKRTVPPRALKCGPHDVIHGPGLPKGHSGWQRGWTITSGVTPGGGGSRFPVVCELSDGSIKVGPIGDAQRRSVTHRCTLLLFVPDSGQSTGISLLTERYLWSFRPLTSQISLCACVLTAHRAHVH